MSRPLRAARSVHREVDYKYTEEEETDSSSDYTDSNEYKEDETESECTTESYLSTDSQEEEEIEDDIEPYLVPVARKLNFDDCGAVLLYDSEPEDELEVLESPLKRAKKHHSSEKEKKVDVFS